MRLQGIWGRLAGVWDSTLRLAISIFAIDEDLSTGRRMRVANIDPREEFSFL